jgi:hypothetical protein
VRVALVLAMALSALVGAVAVAAAPERATTLRQGDYLVFEGTKVRCLLDGDDGGKVRGPVAIHCFAVDPAVERRVLAVGGLPFGRPGSYAVHGTLWGGSVLTKVSKSSRGAFQGIPTVYEKVVARRGDTAANAPRRYSIELGAFTLVNGRVPRLRVRAGDVVRVAKSRLVCRLGHDSTGAPAMGCALEGSGGLVRGAHGFLIADVGAAIADAGESGIVPAVTRYHGR